jgi:hypothetical protein
MLLNELTLGLGQAAMTGRYVGPEGVDPALADRLVVALAALTRARTSLRWAVQHQLSPVWSPPLPAVPPASPPRPAYPLPTDVHADLCCLLGTALAAVRTAGEAVQADAPVAEIEQALTGGVTWLGLTARLLDQARAPVRTAAPPADPVVLVGVPDDAPVLPPDLARRLAQVAAQAWLQVAHSHAAIDRSRHLLRQVRPANGAFRPGT